MATTFNTIETATMMVDEIKKWERDAILRGDFKIAECYHQRSTLIADSIRQIEDGAVSDAANLVVLDASAEYAFTHYVPGTRRCELQ